MEYLRSEIPSGDILEKLIHYEKYIMYLSMFRMNLSFKLICGEGMQPNEIKHTQHWMTDYIVQARACKYVYQCSHGFP